MADNCILLEPNKNSMTQLLRTLLIVCAGLLCFNSHSVAQVVWDREHLDSIRDQPPAKGTEIANALEVLRTLADEALQREPGCVTQKTEVPPSGDVHDYQSFSRYWWPDPDKEDGKPYIRKDGVVNRTLVERGDRVRLGQFGNDVKALALAGHLFKDKRYSEHAAKMVRVWFLDEETKMNPNLNFGQGVPGRAVGRGPGILDTRGFIFVLDSLDLLDETQWTKENQSDLQAWFREYIKWMQEDKLGIHEGKAKNNHGSWYDAQLSRYALFADDIELAKKVLEAAKTKRVLNQFDANGFQAQEIKRTRSLHYSMFNLTALSTLSRVGDRAGVKLWDFKPEHGSGLSDSLRMLLPHVAGESEWPHQQMVPYTLSRSANLMLRLFAKHCSDSAFTDVIPKTTIRHPELDYSALLVGE